MIVFQDMVISFPAYEHQPGWFGDRLSLTLVDAHGYNSLTQDAVDKANHPPYMLYLSDSSWFPMKSIDK